MTEGVEGDVRDDVPSTPARTTARKLIRIKLLPDDDRAPDPAGADHPRPCSSREGGSGDLHRLPVHGSRRNGMTAGGASCFRRCRARSGWSRSPCWRRCLIGVAAAIYLSASTRPTTGSPGRSTWRSSTWRGSVDRSRPVRSRAFVLFFRFGTSILAASLTLAIMTLPVVIVCNQGVPPGRTAERFARPAGTWAPPGGRRSAGSCCPTR